MKEAKVVVANNEVICPHCKNIMKFAADEADLHIETIGSRKYLNCNWCFKRSLAADEKQIDWSLVIESKSFKYIKFLISGQTKLTYVWFCFNIKSDGFLGQVSWYGPWRQYCFKPAPDCIFNNGCLTDIGAFIDLVTYNHKKLKEYR